MRVAFANVDDVCSPVGACAMTLDAAITGVGMSDIGRKTNRPAILHLAEAARRALECAG